MLFKKNRAVLAAVVLMLVACGQESGNAASGGNETHAAEHPATQTADAGDRDADDYDEDELRRLAPAEGKAKMVESHTQICIKRQLFLYTNLTDKAERQRFCNCVADEVFGKMTDAEWKAYLDEAAMFSEVVKKIPDHVDAATMREVGRSGRKWKASRIMSENICMKRLGVTVKSSYSDPE
jgi:hypothetical protein